MRAILEHGRSHPGAPQRTQRTTPFRNAILMARAPCVRANVRRLRGFLEHSKVLARYAILAALKNVTQSGNEKSRSLRH